MRANRAFGRCRADEGFAWQQEPRRPVFSVCDAPAILFGRSEKRRVEGEGRYGTFFLAVAKEIAQCTTRMATPRAGDDNAQTDNRGPGRSVRSRAGSLVARVGKAWGVDPGDRALSEEGRAGPGQDTGRQASVGTVGTSARACCGILCRTVEHLHVIDVPALEIVEGRIHGIERVANLDLLANVGR